jgi:hypothetical protein
MRNNVEDKGFFGNFEAEHAENENRQKSASNRGCYAVTLLDAENQGTDVFDDREPLSSSPSKKTVDPTGISFVSGTGTQDMSMDLADVPASARPKLPPTLGPDGYTLADRLCSRCKKIERCRPIGEEIVCRECEPPSTG